MKTDLAKGAHAAVCASAAREHGTLAVLDKAGLLQRGDKVCL
jgi:hypothetical protein